MIHALSRTMATLVVREGSEAPHTMGSLVSTSSRGLHEARFGAASRGEALGDDGHHAQARPERTFGEARA
ncbi:Hypothetical protein A7982_02803 [Minicystis rosea]|nr:Hypothetical protein A7982_02803 [Minicystis rosea]